ncbi:GDP-L-galactose phosphorylase 1 [Raphanus sativus]|uniref:GDP-L-galactose phosphorylase 1 n=1 Tax=Raphanus sativus TaxID=3726 RepID=A0A9W3CU89_RAPSA|nr:GDP-L-galactose phosphorylase 1 [Raphanus sativus]KAJ4869163.1 GDP-L-galactose phosphorylase 1 [Raphanus sativus]
MLKIKRVPTVVSNYQKDESSDESVGCGRNCLGACCINGARLPLYACKKLEKSCAGEKPVAFLESLVLGEWEDRFQRGLFRYDVTACETKVIPGKYGFVAQLNEGRHLKKRPTEFRVDKVLQSFDGNKFNFTKVGQEELLFQFEAGEDGEVQFFPCMPLDAENSPSVIAINVSPIEYGHVLLIPRVLDCLPQRIDHKSLLLALHMATEAANPYFRLGYNSLGAFATINHLHFQAYYLAMPFPIEKAPSKKMITTASGVKISELLSYPVRSLLFEGGSSMQDLSDTVSDACVCLQNNNIPFNILIADCGRQIFLMPQCYAEKQALGEVSPEVLETQVNPAVWEISGHMVLKRKEDYEGASEENAWRLLAEASLSEERFKEVYALIFEAIGCSYQEEEVEGTIVEQDNPSGSVNQKSNRTTHGGPITNGTASECLVLQ